ncbi:hypothetical protein PAPHI01_2439 [Pancytospora philotis]|nr:hypothetical protein PAPHI01_2439 [Pancytospora philotis]
MTTYQPPNNIFGQPSGQPQQPNSLFNAGNNQPNATGFNPLGQPQQSSSIFGKPADASTVGQPGQMQFGQNASAFGGQFGKPAASTPSFQPLNALAPFGQSFSGASAGPFGSGSPQQTAGAPFGSAASGSSFGQPLPGQPLGSSSLFSGAGAPAAQTAAPFGAAAPFGQSFPSNTAAPSANTTSMFGNTADKSSSTLFGQPAASTTGQPQPFGASTFQNATPSAAQPAPAAGNASSVFPSQTGAVPLAQMFGQNAQQPATGSMGQQSGSFLLGSSAGGAAAPSQTAANSTAQPLNSSAAAESEAPVDQSCLISSIKDSSVNLYNLTLQEIINMQATTLDRNLKDFKKLAQAVFGYDMELIRAKNDYVRIQRSIEQKKAQLDEVAALLDHLDMHLDTLPIADATDMGRVCRDFEQISDAFAAKVEEAKDEQGKVMDLVNANYELMDIVDKKLDIMQEIK